MATSAIPLTEDDLHELYLWVDEIPLSRPKRNIARDFSDGICVAEVVKHFFPKLVELHNYAPANSLQQKVNNWQTLNARVFRKLHFEVPAEEIRDITSAVPGAVERFLRALRTKISQIRTIQDTKQKQMMDGEAAVTGYGNQRASAPRAAERPASAALPQHQPVAAAVRPSTPGSAVPTSTQALRQLLEEKDRTILELRDAVSLLTDKVGKLEELVRVKDEKLLRYKQQLGR